MPNENQDLFEDMEHREELFEEAERNHDEVRVGGSRGPLDEKEKMWLEFLYGSAKTLGAVVLVLVVVWFLFKYVDNPILDPEPIQLSPAEQLAAEFERMTTEEKRLRDIRDNKPKYFESQTYTDGRSYTEIHDEFRRKLDMDPYESPAARKVVIAPPSVTNAPSIMDQNNERLDAFLSKLTELRKAAQAAKIKFVQENSEDDVVRLPLRMLDGNGAPNGIAFNEAKAAFGDWEYDEKTGLAMLAYFVTHPIQVKAFSLTNEEKEWVAEINYGVYAQGSTQREAAKERFLKLVERIRPLYMADKAIVDLVESANRDLGLKRAARERGERVRGRPVTFVPDYPHPRQLDANHSTGVHPDPDAGSAISPDMVDAQKDYAL